MDYDIMTNTMHSRAGGQRLFGTMEKRNRVEITLLLAILKRTVHLLGMNGSLFIEPANYRTRRAVI